jgi:hypothetical protein
MSISKHFVFVVALVILLALVDAASWRPKHFLRRDDVQDSTKRRLLSKKEKSKNSYEIEAEPESLPEYASPVPPGPDLNDWIDGCGESSKDIDSCVMSSSGQSITTNCKTCLFALGSSQNPPPAEPIPNGVKVCAKADDGMCGMCTKEQILPFYKCGLLVEANFLNPDVLPVDGAVDPLNAVVMTDSLTDTFNCPALWPGNKNPCVMLTGFNHKICIYYEHGAGAICTCSSPQNIWECENGPVMPAEMNSLP